MAKFRKKPVVIEAWCFDSDWPSGAPDWVVAAAKNPSGVNGLKFERHPVSGPIALIATLEGVMTAKLGDWIIKGVKGELYPCKPDIFEATYDPVV